MNMGADQFFGTFSYLMLLFLGLVPPASNLTIKKCCPANETLNDYLQCVELPKGLKREEFDWFPVSAIVDAKTLKFQKRKREKYLDVLRHSRIIYGEKPNCEKSEMDATTFNETDKQFTLIMFAQDMRVYVSSSKSLHHPNDAYNFVEDDEEQEDHTLDNYVHSREEVKLRTFPIKNSCIDKLHGRNYHAIFICPCYSVTCIRKCCRDDEYLDSSTGQCSSWKRSLYPHPRWRPKHFRSLKCMISCREMISATTALVFTVTLLTVESSFEINKCCPKNQRLDSELNCIDIDPESDEYDWKIDLPWFPVETVVDSNTQKIHLHRREEYLNVIQSKYKVNYGVIPECEETDTRQFAYHKTDMVEWFNFIMDEDGTMKVHVSKPSSFHDRGKGILFFEKIMNDSIDTQTLRNDSVRTVPLADTCVDLGELSIHVLILCPCRTMLCIRKCCAEDQHFSIKSFGCAENEVFSESWRPEMDGVIENYYLLSDTYPSCDVPILLKYQHEEYSSCNRFNKASDNEFTIFPNGSLKVRKYKTMFDPSQYCGEVTISENGTIEEQNLILCSASKKTDDSYEPITHTLYGVLLIIGGVCLLITVAVSLYLPSLRRKVHNKIALSHNASLMIANFTWAVPQLSTGLSPKSCIVLAFLEQFTLLGSFFWLNVMCIDISMTFRHLKSGRFDGGNKKFVYYCIYAWGSTSLISIITMVMEYNPHVKIDYLKPGFACICGFNTANESMLVYLYGPMTILLLMNLILFVYTTIKIMNIQKQTAMLHKSDSNKSGGSSFKTDKQRYDPNQWLILYGKLFLLMGITWIMEIISWAIGGPGYYWYFSDILNLLRAVFIFVLFIWKKQVYRNLRKKMSGESQSISEKTGSAKSQTDEVAFSTTTAHERCNTNSSKRKGSNKSETEFPKLAKVKSLSGRSPTKESPM